MLSMTVKNIERILKKKNTVTSIKKKSYEEFRSVFKAIAKW
jgi:hypothetical protein